MANHINPLRRYLFRKDFFKKLNAKLQQPLRKMRKDGFSDQQKLLAGHADLCILDIGANLGDVTAKYHALFPTATLHAFEPSPQPFKKLATRFEGNAQVSVHAAAITDTPAVRLHYISAKPM